MFITVACGAISGFHATQSPMMARCIRSEYEGRKVFYGAMVAEGVIALIWAAAGVTVYNGTGGLWEATTRLAGQSALVYDICHTLLGPVGAVLAMLGVIVCPITSWRHGFPLGSSDARGLVRRRPEAAYEAADALSAAASLRRRAVADKFPDYLALFLVVEPDARDDYAVDGGGLPCARAS